MHVLDTGFYTFGLYVCSFVFFFKKKTMLKSVYSGISISDNGFVRLQNFTKKSAVFLNQCVPDISLKDKRSKCHLMEVTTSNETKQKKVKISNTI